MNYKESKTKAITLANSAGVNYVIAVVNGNHFVYPETMYKDGYFEVITPSIQVIETKVKRAKKITDDIDEG